MSKPVLYTFGMSVWAAATELALIELDYTDRDIEKSIINLAEGENFNPFFLQINPNATLPTLTAGQKAYISTTEVIEYLIMNAKTRVKIGSSLIAKIHEDLYDPNFAKILARDEDELNAKANGASLTFLVNRQKSLEKHAATEDAAAHKGFYDNKLADNGHVLAIYQSDVSSSIKNEFFKKSKSHWDAIRSFILDILPTYLPESGLIGGTRPGEDDFHVAAWLARIAFVSGAKEAGHGLKELEKEVGGPIPTKVANYYKDWVQRESWKKVYADGLH